MLLPPDPTISSSTASISDVGVSVALRLSRADLTNLIRYGTMTLDQRLHGESDEGAIHVGRITVSLI